MEDGMKNKENNVYRGSLFLLVLIIALAVLAACNNSSMIPETVVPEIHVKALPAGITSVEFTVSGPDMDPITASYDSLPESLNLAIPTGEDRYFELVVHVGGLLNLTPATSFKGSATVDLTPGDVVIELNMQLDSTKLVVPDYTWGVPSPRILQLNDISGTEFSELYGSAAWGGVWATSFRPYDVDFDNYGRIYIANNFGGGGDTYNCVVRVDTILGLIFIQFPSSGLNNGVTALTVDRNNGYVYYANSASPAILRRSDLDGNGVITLATAGIQEIRGLAVDNTGMLFIAGVDAAGTPYVFKYNPVLPATVLSYPLPNLEGGIIPWDVMCKDDMVYIANPNGADGWKIIQLENNLSSPVGYGINKTTPFAAPDAAPGHFYNPRRFVAILNKKTTVIDDSALSNLGKLVSIDDMAGTNWETYPPSGDGQFEFYYPC
jgi:hypothetical protein